MRYVAAYILAVMGGNASPSAADLTEILGSVGVEVDSAQLDIVIKVHAPLETGSIFLTISFLGIGIKNSLPKGFLVCLSK